MKRTITSKAVFVSVLALAFILVAPGRAFAHVVVTPNEALTGAYETFTTSVPNEKDIPVTEIRLVVPETVESVTPTVKPGWEITTKKTGDTVNEITWKGGSIPAGQRDEFTFSAHLPSKAGDIQWKAYQTYQDGSVVSWDQTPSDDHGHESEDESKGPYSVTTVSDEDKETTDADDSIDVVPYVISVVALGLSVFAVVRAVRK